MEENGFAISPKKEMAFFIGLEFMFLGIMGFIHNPLLGIFKISFLESGLFIALGMIAFFFKTEKKVELLAKVSTGVLGALMFLQLLQANIVTASFYFLLAAIFLYIGFFNTAYTTTRFE